MFLSVLLKLTGKCELLKLQLFLEFLLVLLYFLSIQFCT